MLRKRQADDRVVGVMPSIGNGLRLIPIDRTTPIGIGGTPIIAVACKDFPTAPSLAAYSYSPRAETAISSLRSLSAYHRLAFPGLGNVY